MAAVSQSTGHLADVALDLASGQPWGLTEEPLDSHFKGISIDFHGFFHGFPPISHHFPSLFPSFSVNLEAIRAGRAHLLLHLPYRRARTLRGAQKRVVLRPPGGLDVPRFAFKHHLFLEIQSIYVAFPFKIL